MRRLNLLLMGNNPIEMGFILEKIQHVRDHGKITTEIAFDVKSLFERLSGFNPNFIIIDDNIGREELSGTILALAAKRKTRNIPIAVLKNSNYEESNSSGSILDFVLKQNFTPESLVNSMKNAFKFRRTQISLSRAYIKRKKLQLTK